MNEGARGDNIVHNQIRRHRIGDRDIEMIHQTLSGDCVLINYLNTESLVNGDGIIAMSPHELRQMVIARRRQEGEGVQDILEDNMPLNYSDAVRLFETIYGTPAKQEDIVLVRGNNIAIETLRNNIRTGLLEYLDTYQSGLCTTGMGYHSRTLWKLADNHYVVVDPSNEDGFSHYNKEELVNFLTNLCQSQPAENNFFVFLRTNEDE